MPAITQADLNNLSVTNPDLMQLINSKGIDSIKQQQAGIEDMQAQLEAYQNQNPQIDLSPLAGLVDSWTGSNIARAYNRPMTKEEKDKNVAIMQDALRKSRGAIADNELELLRAALGNQYKMKELTQNDELARIKLMEAGTNRDIVNDRRREKDAIEAENKYKKEYGDAIVGLGELSQGLQRAKASIARNGGEIPLTGPEAAEFQSGLSQLITSYNRDKAKLGALAGGDLNLLVSAVAAGPDALKSWFGNQIKGGGKSTVGVLDRIQQSVDKNVYDMDSKQKKNFRGITDATHQDYVKSYEASKTLFNQPASDPNEDAAALEWAKNNSADPRAAAILQMHGGK